MTKSLHSVQILTSLPKIALQIKLCGMEQEEWMGASNRKCSDGLALR
jgi:hypothetical protein